MRTSFVFLHLSILALAACSASTPEDANRTSEGLNTGATPVARFVPPGTAPSSPIASAPSYGGGPVLSDVQIVAVFWGNNVNPTITSGIGPFYAAMTDSTYMDWLDEYNTPTQRIGRGSLAGMVTIRPFNTNTNLQDSDIQTELSRQISSGNLPAPDKDTLYTVHFPHGVTIVGPAGAGTSCAYNGFCAYHYATSSGTIFSYTVMPDFGPGSGCDVGCGTGTMFQNFTSTASHEVLEAVTDPQPFSGWTPEIGDPCNQEHATITTQNGTQYTVQAVFSAAQNACVSSGAEFTAFPAGDCATDIGVGPDGQAWVIGCTWLGGGGYGVYHQVNGHWVQIPGAQATRIAVSPEGTPWVVNAQGTIYEWNGSTFVSAPPGCANDIGVGPNGEAWVIGCTWLGEGGYGVYHKGNGYWVQIPGAQATRIAVSPKGTPWVINAQGTIYEWNGSTFVSAPPGCANDIGVGPNGEAWVIGCTWLGGGGYGVYHLMSNKWTQIAAQATKIAVSPTGTPWVINNQGSIYE
jgi:hypothetical protein